MFSKSRRPVPSRGALRVLYQLAYISSGTAVGVATLCAEERRRRTRYVQKIADNAKRLRQSPRHVHNVAAAAAAVNEYVVGQDAAHLGEFWDEQSREDDRRGESSGRIEGPGPGKRLVRAYELPSVVETGYAQITKDYKRVRRRGPFDEKMSENRATQGRASSYEPGPTTPHKMQNRPLPAQRRDSRDNPTQRPDRGPRITDRFKIRPDNFPIAIHPPPAFQLKEAAELGQRPKRDMTRENVGNAAVVKHDVELFFHSVPWTSSDLKVETNIASRLLSEALRHRCLTEVRQLISWKLATDTLAGEDVVLLDKAHLTPTSEIGGYDPHEVFELFAELFGSTAFLKLPENLRLSTAISIAADSCSWDMALSEKTRVTCLLLTTLRSSSREDVDHVIRILCHKFLAAGQPRRAYNVVKSVRKVQIGPLNSTSTLNTRWKAVYENITKYAMEHGHIWICVRYATLLTRAGVDPDRVALIEWVLQECRRRKAYLLSRGLIVNLLHLDRWEVLTDRGKVDFALALCVVHKDGLESSSLEKLFRAIPEALRGPVAEGWCADRLQMVWRTQRSLPAVWAEYERAKTFQFERFGTAELTLIEICNKAQQSDQALKLLSNSLQQEAHNATSLCIAAVSMAQKSAWKQLSGLLEIVAKSGKFVNDVSTSRNLNSAIHVFSRHHTAAETWKFVTNMVATIGFAPNKTTTDIMLQCFVSKQTLDMIPRWIRYLRTIGNDFQMTSSTATKLVSCFYFHQRPPHALLMWFSRNLSNQWPSFDAGELMELVKTSIGYDLRKLPAQNKALLRERADHNLATLADSVRGVPAPYRPTSRSDTVHSKPASDSSNGKEQALDAHAQSRFEPLDQLEQQKGDVQHSRQSKLSNTDDLPGLISLQTGNSQTLEQSSLHGLSGDLATNGESFANLRPIYQATDSPLDEEDQVYAEPDPNKEPEHIHEGRRQRRILREMILALSKREHTEVLELYHASLSVTGLPISPQSLEVATEASIRLEKGGVQGATAMLDAAKKAGMEVRCAVGPLLVARIHSLNSAEKKDANAVRTMVIDYYRSNEEDGFPIKHHLGITAANTLINNQRAEYGVNILNAIYHSEWALERSLNIVAMTVYLKGYAMLKSESGIKWVLKKVLAGNMAIDRPFIAALKDACKSFGIGDVVRRTRMKIDRTGFLGELRAGRQQCIARRYEQRFQTKKFGNLLVERILQCVELEKRPGVAVDDREELEEAFFGMPVEAGEGHNLEEETDPKRSPVVVSDMASPELAAGFRSQFTARPSSLEGGRAKARLAMAIRFQGKERTGTRRTLRQTHDSAWLKQYRAFMRKDLIMADGKLASFRRYVP